MYIRFERSIERLSWLTKGLMDSRAEFSIITLSPTRIPSTQRPEHLMGNVTQLDWHNQPLALSVLEIKLVWNNRNGTFFSKKIGKKIFRKKPKNIFRYYQEGLIFKFSRPYVDWCAQERSQKHTYIHTNWIKEITIPTVSV